MQWRFCVFFALSASLAVSAIDVDVDEDCANNEACVDRKLTGILEKFDQEERIPLFGGLEIIKTVDVEPNNAETEEETVVDRLKRYVLTHELVLGNQEKYSARSLGEEARTGKLKKLILPLLLALKLKMAIVLPVVLSTVALIAIKGVFAGLFAILLSGLTALKSFTENKQDHVTAILATPLHSLHHHDLKWGRQDVVQEPSVSPVEAYNLPYAGYQNLIQNALPLRTD